MRLRKCSSCKAYTLKKRCPKCNKETLEAHHKYVWRGDGRGD